MTALETKLAYSALLMGLLHLTAILFAPVPRKEKRGGGRPRIGEEAKTITHRKPWLIEGMSERTWWRRRAEQR
jgi:hypothetical protein